MLGSKFVKLFLSFFKAQVSFRSNIASIFSATKQNSRILFLAQKLCTLFKRSPLKCKFLRFSSARVKICQIHHVSFELTSQFHFKFFIIIQCNYTELLCKFLAHAFSTLGERISSKSQFWHFQVLVKICQIPHFIFQTASQFFFKFWLFSVMKDDSFLLFQVKR